MHVHSVDNHGSQELTAEKIIIAVGTTATKSDKIPFDHETIFTSDEILDLARLPKTLAVIGAGVIGTEYTTIFAALGVDPEHEYFDPLQRPFAATLGRPVAALYPS